MTSAYCSNKRKLRNEGLFKTNGKMACELPQPFPSIFILVGITIPINKGMNKYVDKGLITMWSKYVYNFLMSSMIIISDTAKPGYNLHM